MNRPPNFTVQLLTVVLLSMLVASASSSARTSARAASTATPGQSPLTWVTVAPPGENFSVRMPKQPSQEAVEQANMPGLTGTAYSASSSRIYYTVKSINNVGRGGTPRSQLTNFIARYRESFLQAAGAGSQMTYSRDVSLDGFTGQHYRLITRSLRGIARFYATEHRIYVLEASGGDDSDPQITWFLDSFSITRPSAQLPPTPRQPSPRQPLPRNNDGGNARLRDLLNQLPPQPLRLDNDRCECGDADENVKSEMSVDGRLTRDAIICSKGDLELTEEALKHRFNREVMLRVELLHTGQVGSIEVEQGQPYGLTEKAIEFARQYKFCPALLRDQPVTQILPLTCRFTVTTYTQPAAPARRPQPRRRRP